MGNKNKKRIIIENICPLIDNGIYPIKREVGDKFKLSADIFRDGHQIISANLNYRHTSHKRWQSKKMLCTNPGLDIWEAEFSIEEIGFYEYKIEGFCDDFGTWIHDTKKKVDANVDFSSDILEGIELVKCYMNWLKEKDRLYVKSVIEKIKKLKSDNQIWAVFSDDKVQDILCNNPDPETMVQGKTYYVRADRQKARYASWYECFPRSCGFEQGKGGTFADVIKRLPHISKMGFDVLYFPPIHPVGFTKRKGPNNSLICGENDPGCPYSIGNKFGGHDAIEPSLGTMKDFEILVEECANYNMEIALDFAINCSPDHPYLKSHPDWFRKRPDGTIKFAENPPKKYEDIYPINFESSDHKAIWKEMKRIFLFWAKKGIRIFRVDNPHTKPFAFWRWVIFEVQKKFPDTIFLAEAFTRPKVMKSLAKLGFTQSYSYFTWRNEKNEITEYFEELTTKPESDYYRANLFTNTPDIFPVFLQTGGRPAYKIRAVLAATLSSVYGIFQGFELCEGKPVQGKEEYADSDKYEAITRDWSAPGNIIDTITRLNNARKNNPALQEYDNLKFYESSNDKIIFYGKSLGNNHFLIAVNLDPHHTQSALVEVPINLIGVDENQGFQVHDMLTDKRYLWQGKQAYVELNPELEPAHVFKVIK